MNRIQKLVDSMISMSGYLQLQLHGLKISTLYFIVISNNISSTYLNKCGNTDISGQSERQQFLKMLNYNLDYV